MMVNWDFDGKLIWFSLQGHEPFVSYESLEQLHRFLFLLGITHVLYSCIAVVLAMIKVKYPFPCKHLWGLISKPLSPLVELRQHTYFCVSSNL